MMALAWLIPCALALGLLGLAASCGRSSRVSSRTSKARDGGPFRTTSWMRALPTRRDENPWTNRRGSIARRRTAAALYGLRAVTAPS